MSSNPKELLIATIKEWIEINNRLNEVMKVAKEYRAKKKQLTDSLVTIMKNNEIDCFDINNGKIMYSKNNVKKPITKKHLLNCLSNYFDDVSGINSDNVVQFILDNREIVIKDNIRLKNK